MDGYIIVFVAFLLSIGIMAIIESKQIMSKKILNMIVYPVLLTSFLAAGDIINNPQQWSAPLQIAIKVLLNLYYLLLLASPQLPIPKIFKRLLYITALIILLYFILKLIF